MARVAPTDLLDELEGLRSLARSLVRGGDADDLVQDTAVVALQTPPEADRPVRPWLATVLRNRWRMDRRGVSRRQEREGDAGAEPQPVASADALLDRARLLERLAAALVALDEPFREAVILRYLDGRSAAEIARALGLPDATVRWRVRAGLERLREALDREAPRGVWQRALFAAPLGAVAAAGGGKTGLLLGAGFIMKSKSIVIGVLIALVLLVGGGLGLRAWRSSSPAPPTAAEGAGPRAAGDRPLAPRAAITGGSAGPAAADPDPLPGQGRAVVEAVAAPGGGFRGRVINWSTGVGVAAAELTFSAAGGDVTTIRSDDGGGFELVPAQPGAYTLATVEASGYLPYAPEWEHSSVRLVARGGERVRGLTVFLFPALDYRGRVVDQAGAPVAGATVRLLGSPSGEQALAGPSTAWRSDAQGEFVFHAPDDAVLAAEAGGKRGRARLDGDAAITHQLVIALGDEPAADGVISGRVFADGGVGLPGVLVRAWPAPAPGAGPAAAAREDDQVRAVAFTVSDAQGRFRLRDLDRGDYDLTAAAEERAPAMVAGVASGADDVRLVLAGDEALVGKVTDASGAAVPAFTLLVFRRIGVYRSLFTTRSVVDSSGRFSVRVAGGDDGFEVVATAAGWAPSAPTAASPGDPVTLTLVAGAVIRGRVVSGPKQEPLPYARVRREAAGGGPSAAPANAGTVTRDDGTFELTGIPPGPVALFFGAGGHHPRIEAGLTATDGATIGPFTVTLTPLADGEAPSLELVGIGVKLVADGDALRVDGVIPGGGAEAAGVVVGDRLTAVEDIGVAELGLDGAITRIRGVAGTRVRITLVREGAIELELEIERRAIRS